MSELIVSKKYQEKGIDETPIALNIVGTIYSPCTTVSEIPCRIKDELSETERYIKQYEQGLKNIERFH